MDNPIKVAKTIFKHFGIGTAPAQEPEKKPAPVKAGIQPKKSNVVKHNEALKDALDLPDYKKKKE